MLRHISKGSWTFSDQDHGWQVSDCTAEGLKCCLLLSQVSPETLGEQLDPIPLHKAAKLLTNSQMENGTGKLRCDLFLNMLLVSVGVVVSSYGLQNSYTFFR